MSERLFRNRAGQRRGQGAEPGGGKGRGGGNQPGSGPGGFCVCPQCGHKEAHIAGQRCLDKTCPKCGTKLVRE